MVVVAAIATSTAAATTATRRRDGNPTATVMDGDGQCNGNVTATTAMEGVRQQQWMAQRRHDGNNGDGRHNGDGNGQGKLVIEVAMEMRHATATTTMDSARATVIDSMTATRRLRSVQW